MLVSPRPRYPIQRDLPSPASDKTLLIALEIILGTLLMGGCVALALASGVNVVSSLVGVGGGGAALLAIAVTTTHYCSGREQAVSQNINVVQLEPVALDASRRVRSPDGEATLYISPSLPQLIGDDSEFNFYGRLKDETNTPFQIDSSDCAVALEGTVTSGNIDRLNRNARNEFCMMRLPSILFQGVSEGESVLFYCDNQLYKITCRQKRKETDREEFPEALNRRKSQAR